MEMTKITGLEELNERFQLLPGYVNPRVTYGTENGIDENDLRELFKWSNRRK